MGELIRREAPAAPRSSKDEDVIGLGGGFIKSERSHRYVLAREFCRGKDILAIVVHDADEERAFLAQVARSAKSIGIGPGKVIEACPELQFLPDASVDVLLCLEALEQLSDLRLLLSEAKRILRPDGLLIVGTAPRGEASLHHAVMSDLDEAEFRELLRHHFSNTAFGSQRLLVGSVILGSASEMPLRDYEAQDDAVTEVAGIPFSASSIIALASDAALPAFPNSFYTRRGNADFGSESPGQVIASLRQEVAVAKILLAAKAERHGEAVKELKELLEWRGIVQASTVWRILGFSAFLGQRFPRAARLIRKLIQFGWWTVSFQLGDRYRMWHRHKLLKKGLLPNMDGKLPAQASEIIITSSDDPLVSVIIPTYGQVDFTLACLNSIMEHAPGYPIEVIVVDDAYAGSENVAQLAEVKGIRLIRNPENLGFLRTCNAAAREVRGRYIYMLNNDTQLQPGTIDTLVELLESRPDVGMAGSKLLYPDGTLQEAGAIIWSDASGWNYGRGDDPKRPQYNYPREVDYCSGASILIRRDVFEDIGGFEDALAPAYYEDMDLAFRIRERGMKVMYEPRSEILHFEGISHGTDLTSGVKAHQVTNQAWIVKRWGATLAKENYPNANHVLRARDRARERKVILVIDHYVPEPDRDAGSRSTMGILDSLVDAGWVVKFWPHNRFYSSVYTPVLEQRGIEVLDCRWPGTLEDWLRENGSDLDHLMVHRPDIAVNVLPQIVRNTDAVFSFYGHDLHFARMMRQAELTGDRKLMRDAAVMERMERRLWRNFDIVLYPSEEEAQTVRDLAPKTLARGITPFCFDAFPARMAPPKQRSILFVAGFAHPPNVDAAVFLVKDIVPKLEQQIGPVQIILAGSKPTKTVRDLAGPNVEVTGYVTDEVLGRLYDTHRVAIVPLRFGAGVKGKVVEALARGLPLVTTPVGAQGIPGLEDVVPVHEDATALVAALKRLLTDDAGWMQQSQAQREFAQQNFSRAAMQRSVLSALETAEEGAKRQSVSGDSTKAEAA